MIELLVSANGRRVAIVCDACSRPVVRAADAVLIAWASQTALVCHSGECAAALRRQYPSTTAEPAIRLDEALGRLVVDLDVVAVKVPR